MYELTKLIHEQGTNRIFIEVIFKGYPIQKWFDPSEPSHVDDINDMISGNMNKIQSIVNSLGDELKVALKHPDIDILDENDNIKVKPTIETKNEVDLIEKFKLKIK